MTGTAKVNLYYEELNRLRKSVFIAKNDCYEVVNSDLTVKDGEGVYFVGTSTTQNHGIDFSGVNKAIDVTLNTDYDSTTAKFWVNNIHSIIGGAGRTTIIGSDKADTIIAGKGTTTIDAGAGKDRISLSSGKALVNYKAGDGNDIIYGFSTKSTLNISGAPYSTQTSGSNVIVAVNNNKITLSGTASLSKLNISGVAEEDVLTVDNDAASPVTLDAKTEVVDASRRTTPVQIVGNSKNNSISGGTGADTISGNNGNDTIYGDAGNDSLVGGSSNDVLNGEGTDKIFDYAISDLLKILNKDGTEGGSFKNSSFSGNYLTLTINGGGKVIFYNVSSGDKFNINGKTYTLSDNTLK